MIKDTLFPLIGGLGLFFFGMQTLSGGLKQIAGNKLKNFLHAVTKHRIYGVTIGTIATLLVQSSSATTVMVIGFINAGLLNLRQAITLIMGANIGTTFTAWLVSSMSVFKISSYALPAVGIGFAIKVFSKTHKRENFGRAMLGFGLLFIGLSYLKDSFAPLKDSPAVQDLFVTFGQHPILGVLCGIIFTILLQSSSATIAIVQVLAFNGLISFEAAIPIILGDNIGTTVTAQMAAVGTNLNARRGAMAHTIFNVIGVTYVMVFYYLGWFTAAINWIVPGDVSTENVMFYIAVSHSAFNCFNTMVFLPFVGTLEQICVWLVPKRKDSIDYGTQYLERHLLDAPNLAIEQIHKEICYLQKIACKAVTKSMNGFLQSDLKQAKEADELESVTDSLQDAITEYIIELSRRELTHEQSEELPVFIHMVNDLERVGDHAQNVVEMTKRRISMELVFSEEALKEIDEVWGHLRKMFEESQEALTKNDIASAKRVLMEEKIINGLQNDCHDAHIRRLKNGRCQPNAGYVFTEMVDNMEKIADRLTNIAESIEHKLRWKSDVAGANI